MAFGDPYTSEEWPLARDEVGGLEFDWFGLDQTGQLGVFSSAGSGPVPDAVFRAGMGHYNALLAFLATRELAGATLVFRGSGNYRDWEIYARHGLYAFDFHDVHRTSKEARGGYDLIYRPVRPVVVADLPEGLRLGLSALPVAFGDGEIVPTVLLASL